MAADIHNLFADQQAQIERLKRAIDSGGEPPDDDLMEERVKKLEDLVERTGERIVNIERDTAVVRSNYSTKDDMAKLGLAMQAEINTQTWKLVTFVCGFGTALVAATYFIATHIK